MNVAELIAVKNQIEDFQNQIDELKQKVTKLELATLGSIKRNPDTKAGVGTKISYDKYGLVTGNISLDPEDIPNLSMTKIDGLNEALNQLDQKINNLSNKKNIEHLIQAGTGTKINYNSNGQVVSSTSLKPEDIPELPISKIKGLKEYIELKPTEITVKEIEKRKELTEQDIPKTIIRRLNNVEELVNSKADKDLVNQLDQEIHSKPDPIVNISDGIYTKIQIKDKKIINGNILNDKDIPELETNKIKSLEKALSKLAPESSVIELRSLMSLFSKTTGSQFNILRSEMENKVNYSDFVILENVVMHNDELVKELLDKIDIEKIRESIIEIKNKLQM